MTHKSIHTKKILGLLCAVAFVTSSCSLSSTASDSTTSLPSVTAASSTDVATDDSASSSVQTAAERYGTDTASTALPTLTNADKVRTAGLGPVRIGHTLEEAQEAAGVTFNAASTGSERCQYYTPAAGATGASFMVVRGEVLRIDISSGPITTKSGYGIGSTKDAIKSAFGSKIKESSTGDSLTFVPVTAGDSLMRIIWELDSTGVVTSLRVGRTADVTPKVGCSAS